MTDDSLRDSYFRDGYVVAEGLIDADTLAALRRVTDQLIDAARHVAQSDARFDLDSGHSASTPRLTRIKLPHTQHAVYHDVLHSDAVRTLLTGLLGTADVRLHTSKLNCKAPGGGRAVEWHQDWAFYPHTNDNVLALGIWLDDVTEANGPLLAIPGSHAGPVLDHTRDGVFVGAIDPSDSAFAAPEARPLTGPAGSASVHHVRTLHGSAPNHSASARRVLFFECCAADAWPLAGIAGPYNGLSQAALLADLRGRMVFGELPLQPRLADVPVTMPLPPPPDDGSIFAVQRSGGAVSAFGPGN
ncbi:MAG: phytanoyl-CoA dioxygenase family protein [Pseudomonadota bacterium]